MPWGLSAAYRDTQPVPEIPDAYAKEMASTLAAFKNRAVTVDTLDATGWDDDGMSTAYTRSSSISEEYQQTPPPARRLARLREVETLLKTREETEMISDLNSSRLLMFYVRKVDENLGRARSRSWSTLGNAPIPVALSSIKEPRLHNAIVVQSGSLRHARTQRVFSDPMATIPSDGPEREPKQEPPNSFNWPPSRHKAGIDAPQQSLVKTAVRSILDAADGSDMYGDERRSSASVDNTEPLSSVPM